MTYLTKKQTVRVYLSKKGTKVKDCFDADKIETHEADNFELKKELKSTLYFYKKPSEEPIWKDFIDESFTPDGKKKFDKLLENQSFAYSGLLAMELNGRCAMITFGYGYSLIDWAILDQDFGKKIIINTADINKYVSIRSSVYEQYPRYLESQGSVEANLTAFELDFELQMLKKLTADFQNENIEVAGLTPKDIGLRVTGDECFSFNTYLKFEDIKKVLTWLVTRYEAKPVDDFFTAIDTFKSMEDTTRIQKLNEQVVVELNKKSHNFHVVIPFMIDFKEYSQFKYIQKKRSVESTVFDLLNAEDFKKFITDQGDSITLSKLKTEHKAICISNTGNVDKNIDINVFRCLTGELDDNGERCALMNGKWYIISKDFFKKICTTLDSKIHTTSALTSFDPSVDVEGDNLSEKAYNLRQFDLLKGSIHMDRVKITFRGRGSIEPCDLIHKNSFYHVKRYTSSSTLSHLFFQGSVSTSALLEDQEIYREKFLSSIVVEKERNRIKDLIEKKELEVVYAILFPKGAFKNPAKGLKNLPSFSIVSLYKTYKDFLRMGVKFRVEMIFDV